MRKRLSGNNLFLLLSFIYILASLLFISQSKGVGTTTDEYGYLYGAARVLGWDWSDVMQYHSFYGQGLSILWAPLFYVFQSNMVLAYQAILVLNVLFLIGSAFALKLLCQNLFPSISATFATILAFVTILYPGYIYNSQSASSESILLFLFCWDSYALYRYLHTKKYRYWLIFILLLSIIPVFHFRTVALLACVVLLSFIMLAKRQLPLKLFLLLFCSVVLGVIFTKAIQNQYYIDVAANEVTSQNSSIPIVLYIKNIFVDPIAWIKAALGKVYYFLNVGNIVIVLAMLALVRDTYKYLFKRDGDNETDAFCTFLLLTFIANLIAFSIQMMYSFSRFDYPVYSRYLEYLVAPIIMIGLVKLTEKRLSSKWLVLYVLLLIPLTQVVMHQLENVNGYNVFALDSAPGFGAYFNYYMGNQDIYVALLKATCYPVFILAIMIVFNLIGLIKEFNKIAPLKSVLRTDNLKYLNLMVVAVFWMFITLNALLEYIPIRKDIYNSRESLISEINSYTDSTDILYLKNKEDNSLWDAKALQLSMGARKLGVTEKTDSILEEDSDPKLIIVDDNNDKLKSLKKKLKKENVDYEIDNIDSYSLIYLGSEAEIGE